MVDAKKETPKQEEKKTEENKKEEQPKVNPFASFTFGSKPSTPASAPVATKSAETAPAKTSEPAKGLCKGCFKF